VFKHEREKRRGVAKSACLGVSLYTKELVKVSSLMSSVVMKVREDHTRPQNSARKCCKHLRAFFMVE
jgi:hypothetical protein